MNVVFSIKRLRFNMDDCCLEKLSVKPGKLAPAFHRDVTDYSVTVGSEIGDISIDLLTSDESASYSIWGADGGKTISLKEGTITDIKIEVTAEDGTTKSYFIHVKRTSSNDAFLTELQLSAGNLSPPFSSDTLEYSCILPCNVSSLKVTLTSPDTKSVVQVCGTKPGSSLDLNVGETLIDITVTSANGSKKQMYTVCVIRQQIPRHVTFLDDSLALQYECPISLSALYCPVTIKGSKPKHTFSMTFIDELTKTSKFDPLSSLPLDSDWRILDYDLDRKMTSAMVHIPLTYGGYSETLKFGEIGSYLEKCIQTPKMEGLKDKLKKVNVPVKAVEVRNWEKQLQQVYGESNVVTLSKAAENELDKYFKSLPKPGHSTCFPEGESPLNFLHEAACNIASAIKLKSKDANLHLKLGQILEEKYYAEDLYGLKKEDTREPSSFNLKAQESSKKEECDAICKLHGVEAGALLAQQLKAIDTEYHHLLGIGQIAKADHVQNLYAWKSKQAIYSGAAAHRASDEDSPIGQAYLKYVDAMTIDETDFHFNFHVGRMLVVQGNFSEAVKRLEITLNWNPQHQMSRFLLGLALSLQRDGPGKRSKEVIGYLLEGMEALLTENTKNAVTKTEEGLRFTLLSDNLIRSNNVYLLQGIIQLGKVILQTNSNSADHMSAKNVFHTAALLASQALSSTARGNTYKQVEWVLLEAHSQLLEILSANQKGNETLIAQRCQWLSALIHQTTIRQNNDLLILQEKTCQWLVQAQPCNSHSLFLLGSAQLARYNSDPTGAAADQFLQDSKISFLASIASEGKSTSGDAPEQVKGQKWWQVQLKKDQGKGDKDKAPPAAAPKEGRGSASKPLLPVAGRGRSEAAPAAVRGARGPTATVAKDRILPSRGATVSKGLPIAKPKTEKSVPGKIPPTPNSETVTASKSKEAVNDTSAKHTAASKQIILTAAINQKTYLPRLGLARILRITGEIDESRKYYNEVISMSPEVHDAYIEMAEMLAKNDPLAAVDVYAKFPVSETPTFDDAYIFCEIIRLLINNEQYDDPRLGPMMIAYGKVLGMGSLEKYVEILDSKFKIDTLKFVYAEVNNKAVDDPDLQAFFKFKCWI